MAGKAGDMAEAPPALLPARAWQGQGEHGRGKGEHGRGKGESMAGASPATTIRAQRLFQRGIVVAPLAGAMPPLRMLCSLTQKFYPVPNMPDSTISSISGGILGLFISDWSIYGSKRF